MESKNGTDDFVTVVSVGAQPKIENFVTVLSIGDGKNEGVINGHEGHLDEEVEVYRLPGERLGFGLKFEGGNKTSELVRRLFVQSCAEHSPASRAKCSWGSLGEGDEILSIDGVPVTQMSRLDCVRHLKESQLVIKLLMRCRGALRPEVVSAERKTSPEKNKIPPELPSLPPPVPPRKLRQARGSADGDANPSPVKKVLNGHVNNSLRGGTKSTNFEVSTNKINSSQKSPESAKNKQEPPEAMVYIDARSQDGSSTHGSTSDETSSSMSTVVDRVSTTSDHHPETLNISNDILEAFDHLDNDYCTQPDYLLKRLANSEAVTHVESRGEAGGVVEKITAVVAPNTVLIEETLTIQPPLSFQDAPLSYGHEARPGVFYTADLAADSSTHFRPISDDASTVESVNGDEVSGKNGKINDNSAPPLPARNHVNRIPVNQIKVETVAEVNTVVKDTEVSNDNIPVLPPKPLPRKDSKLKRKRMPPPPPPPTAPRREAPPPVPVRNLELSKIVKEEENDVKVLETSSLRKEENGKIVEESIGDSGESREIEDVDASKSEGIIEDHENEDGGTNKVLEIIEMKKIKAFNEIDDNLQNIPQFKTINNNDFELKEEIKVPILSLSRNDNLIIKNSSPESSEFSGPEVWEEAREHQDEEFDGKIEEFNDENEEETYESLDPVDDFKLREAPRILNKEFVDTDSSSESSEDNDDDYYWQSNLATIGEEEETPSLEYTSVNKEPAAVSVNSNPCETMIKEKNDTTNERDETEPVKEEESKAVDKKLDKKAGVVNGRMDNCGGGQRLPPDGDEFPAAYQEFSASVQQYQYVLTPRGSSTMSSNGAIDASETYELTKTQEITETRLKTKFTNKPETMKHPETNTYRDNKNGIVLSEKKIEISSYYPKEIKLDDKIDGNDGPPPLPLTGPPKIDKPIKIGRSLTDVNVNARKFSLNSELRRQDDKSEKSVRDKIAMFSKSTIDAPLFPNNQLTNVTLASRKLSKYKSSEDFFIDDNNKCSMADRSLSSLDLTDTCKSDVSSDNRSERPPSLPRSSPPDDSLNSKGISTNGQNVTLTSSASLIDIKSINTVNKNGESMKIDCKNNTPLLTRATSFSGGISCGELSQTNGQVSRANSLASTFRRTEDMRRTSLNQLIEQRKKGISKLRGLVIPEKDTVPVDQPIIDLPEIKSRDSILVQQKASNITDKWGSQSSLTSNTSTQSMPIKTPTFKMPAPQILPKYSPAFKRKSLTVYGTSNVTASNNQQQTSPASAVTPTEPPKSLESICSPTRSDYSFEFVSSSVSPDNIRNRKRINQRKVRGDYDDSDNDSAVSSSQSSISRGFSPSTSPVPSERSNISSERSYAMIMEPRNYLSERQFGKTTSYQTERNYLGSNRSSSGSSSGSSSNPRSPPPEHNCRFTSLPQRQLLKRSSSTETNCSTSSTLTSGSQASAESLSRRVLKPQSVEAINRKNILASARCRSGRDLNGSPLIQRKFSDDEETQEQNGSGDNTSQGNENVKIAYVEVIENFVCNEEAEEELKLPPKRSMSVPVIKPPPKPDVVQPSDDLKNWVRTEAKALIENSKTRVDKPMIPQTRIPRTRSSLTLEEANTSGSAKRVASVEAIDVSNKCGESQNDDLLTTLATKSRSRAPINLEDTVLRSKSQMSLEDILAGRAEPKRPETHMIHSVSHSRLSLDSRDGRPPQSNSNESDEKTFVSKIPAYGRCKNETDEGNGVNERSRTTKIPMQRSLGRRSASVTDMKKAIDKQDYPAPNHHHHQVVTHHRFPSLDSSVEENIRPVVNDNDAERFYGEQFGSISSLASSTSLISQQELAQLVEEASLEEARGSHDVIVVLLHKENPSGSVGITLAGGVDCEAKEITVHRVLAHSIADKDGRVQRGDRILSINGRSTRGLNHRESLAVLKQPRSEVVLVVSRAKIEEGGKLRGRTESVETIVEGFEMNGVEDTAWGPPTRVAIIKDGAGLGFSLEGGRDSPLGDKPLVIKKIFTGGAAEKTGALTAGDQLLEVNGTDVTRLSRIEAWSLMKKLQDGEVNLLVRHPATKST